MSLNSMIYEWITQLFILQRSLRRGDTGNSQNTLYRADIVQLLSRKNTGIAP